ncbi:fructose-bisphosphate aldolase, class I [Nematocida homosporus]|uniref:fructose-bisphosphate aldolase, class I n=1 Tax=Nematocida homosporus TaxID=1912981 RepID=UPI00221E6D5D|nr:fructose-bisphosphate aldolase, class I [Nematocida homosporus]KAI5186027.1 fructose-bisphosphate aldolase, class I [Nematocida homosporus]
MEDKQELEKIANGLVEGNKGILAIDESPKSMEKKFGSVGIPNTEENRRRYREVLLTAPAGIEQYLGGVILNEETFPQKDSQGKAFVTTLREKGIFVGVKLDKGLLPLGEGMTEQISTGLDDLSVRCQKYREGGASFAKWRSVFSISKSMPSEECIYKNCDILSEYALICQKNRLVPVVEPEVLFDGTHTGEECEITSASVISCLIYHFNRKGVHIPGLLLKLGFVTSGSKNERLSLEEVASGTIRAFMWSIPPSVPGVVFLSGGHPEDVSVEYLKEVNMKKRAWGSPWVISYSFGRALQDSVLHKWGNKDENKADAQQLLLERARICSQAIASDQ